MGLTGVLWPTAENQLLWYISKEVEKEREQLIHVTALCIFPLKSPHHYL